MLCDNLADVIKGGSGEVARVGNFLLTSLVDFLPPRDTVSYEPEVVRCFFEHGLGSLARSPTTSWVDETVRFLMNEPTQRTIEYY